MVWVLVKHDFMGIGWFVHSTFYSYDAYKEDKHMQTLINMMCKSGYIVRIVK